MSQFIFPPLTASLDSEASSGAALPSAQMIVGGFFSGTSVVYPLAVDADGQLQVDVVSSMPLPSGAATSALQGTGNDVLVTINTSLNNIETDADTSAGAVANIQSAQGATDTGIPALVVRNDTLADLSGADGDYAPLQVNNLGAVYVDVVSSDLPSGAATEATLADIDADTSALFNCVDAGGSQMQVDIVADGAGLATEATLGTIDTDTGNIATSTAAVATSTASVATSTAAVATSTAAVATSTAAVATSTASIATSTASVATNTTGLNSCVDAGSSHLNVDVVTQLPSGTNNIGDVDVLSLPADSKNYVWKEGLDSTAQAGITDTILDTSTTNIPSGTQLIVATLTNDIYEIQTVEDIGEFIGIYAASVLKAILPLGGGSVKINLPSTTVVKLASFSGTPISSGKIAINFLG
jgi:hypothetical protein